MEKSKVYHVYTKGLEKRLWFFDDDDYKSGMNSIPVCAWVAGVTVCCFCLMSNHVHFILRGEEDACIRFIREYKRQRTLQLKVRYDGRHTIAGSDVGIKVVDKEDYMRYLVAYVLRNPMAAGLGIQPSQYRWNSGNLYFSEMTLKDNYKKLGDLSISGRRRLLKSRVNLPEKYLVSSDGIVFPGSYVDYRFVEQTYISVKQFLFYLSSLNEMEEELESGILTKVHYDDSELFASMENICSDMYHGRKYLSLRIEDRYKLARVLRKRYGAGPKQISRVMSLDYNALKKML